MGICATIHTITTAKWGTILKKKETALIALLGAAAILLWGGLGIREKNKSEMIHITVDGEDYGTWRLSKNETIKIGETNVCEIKDGKVRMIKADCPDHLCMKQSPIDKNGGMIVCLPNKVIIEGKGTPDSAQTSGAAAVN